MTIRESLMRHAALALLLGLAAAGPIAAKTTVTDKRPVTVTVSTPEHDFVPQVIRMPGGRPVRLVLRNPSGTDHNFHAPVFFAKAQINQADSAKVWDGTIKVRKNSTVSVRLIATPGHYDLTSDLALDRATGMQGQILVD